ncbi:hypothetical protein B0O99DRAFT_168479 [Bisporella sp. PMI_857]|nr:hypothetical protein B0O99DRAFT_168479 [Bisporella sp. PMI_857]
MATIRLKPFVEIRCRVDVYRCFHSASTVRAKTKPAISPRVKRLNRGHKPIQPPLPASQTSSENLDENLPSPNACMNAFKEWLPINAELQRGLLRRYQVCAKANVSGWERNLCDEFGIKPRVLSSLALVILSDKLSTPTQKRLARDLMFSAYRLGDTSTTYQLVEIALRSKAIQTAEMRGPIQELGRLAGSGDSRAAIVLGSVLLSQNKVQEALKILRAVTSSDLDSVPPETAGEAFYTMGEIYLTLKDKSRAIDCYQKSALDYNDPRAYHQLGILGSNDATIRRLRLSKAAQHGLIASWHSLGILELIEVKSRPGAPKKFRDFGMAREWFQVAAADKFGPSMLEMANMCFVVGDNESGEQWLDHAENLPDVRWGTGALSRPMNFDTLRSETSQLQQHQPNS